jgi:hypothetical protein
MKKKIEYETAEESGYQLRKKIISENCHQEISRDI